MLKVFQLKNNYLFRIDEKDLFNAINDILWVDIIKLNNNENYCVQHILEQYKVNFFKLKDIESKRFCSNQDGTYISSFFFSCDDHNQISNVIVFFIIHNDRLYTLRGSRFPVFCTYQRSLSDHWLGDGNAYELLLSLFSVKIDDLTDKIENIYSTLETLSFVVMGGQQIDEYDSILSDLAELESMSWKIQINLLDTERAIKFLARQSKLPTTQKRYANEILNDIILLLSYNESIFQKVSFLTQSVMGLINIEQNRIIKIFSIVFLPPTLIASSYGMNFEFMPELKWLFGYPIAIILMILTGLVPYLYFKYKNWL
ncbi:Magnesium transport protein corA [Candidatus Blochmanniella vafra str. BVAF]|uniref:Magnesium transport protein CorA n=1 Tax=Blochmanniella vafra (strain BVAF) TaxID=859654 RepID=E8Q6I8_BLOVB|nr:magnesium/cobalt transporter CorA [Candidatus Blochmannia vafer]ADV33957.1 Magnesium transport protein corA [Candidatus Blochmannia vafer str. BVAF]